ncbi:BadF/BadG/BcrA/BcrD ATPase family [Verrucomicrobiia bacterium DG1235]|nr:BadF/BadG/BcrA/BcrD ATPase family [Verrucomicrobiae bacterium DG1235]
MPTPQAQAKFIGVDGGGTSTKAIAIDRTGKEIGSGRSEGSNPNNIGFPQAASNILEAIRQCKAPLDSQTSLCIGIAGLATEEQTQKLRDALLAQEPTLKQSCLTFTHDLEIAHFAAFQEKPGMVLIAGTGSACYARNSKGETFRASGRDFDYEDPGSGYAIGKRANESKLLLAADSRKAIASIAPRVIELASEGDLRALDILRIEAENIAKLARAVYVDFSKTETFPELALSGSILQADTLYRYSVLFELQSALHNIKVIETKTAPELAAAQLAKSTATL